MRVLSLDRDPLTTLDFLDAAPKGGSDVVGLQLLDGRVDVLPPDLDGLLVTSDLQGVCNTADGRVVLLGVALAELYADLSWTDDRLPRPERVGVILAGDLFSDPTASVRGATGDVRAVWRAFAERFAFVAGVAGNHDLFGGSARERLRFEQEPGVHLLDGRVAEVTRGFRVGGVSGIIGADVARNERKTEDEFLRRLDDVLGLESDLLVLHDPPDGLEPRLKGRRAIRERLLASPPRLTVAGHEHWPRPLVELEHGGQILNVCERAVLLRRASTT